MGSPQLFKQMSALCKAFSYAVAINCELGHGRVGILYAFCCAVRSLIKLCCAIKGSFILIMQHGYRVINQPASH